MHLDPESANKKKRTRIEKQIERLKQKQVAFDFMYQCLLLTGTSSPEECLMVIKKRIGMDEEAKKPMETF